MIQYLPMSPKTLLYRMSTPSLISNSVALCASPSTSLTEPPSVFHSCPIYKLVFSQTLHLRFGSLAICYSCWWEFSIFIFYAEDVAMMNSATVKDLKLAIKKKVNEMEQSKMGHRHISWYVYISYVFWINYYKTVAKI